MFNDPDLEDEEDEDYEVDGNNSSTWL